MKLRKKLIEVERRGCPRTGRLRKLHLGDLASLDEPRNLFDELFPMLVQVSSPFSLFASEGDKALSEHR